MEFLPKATGSSTVSRLRHGQDATTQLIDDLCNILDCKVEDVIVFEKTDKEQLNKKPPQKDGFTFVKIEVPAYSLAALSFLASWDFFLAAAFL
ncbi:MAG: helix-turn-helix transcriptional regulator [Oscillospiraceae bacterium]|nr:helix-turn-helix transcriptional regulator [Oscillospiraceae bacterium]